MQNASLIKKTRNTIKDKKLFSYIKMGKEILAFLQSLN